MSETLSLCDLDILAWLLHEGFEPTDRTEERGRFYLLFEKTSEIQEAMSLYHGEVTLRLTEYARHRSRAKAMLFRPSGDLGGA
ncbi:unnamed protein product [marine sediment metagenome]|uniref:DUF5659 domain-containing protein n=1 Tax=marine sediment metagenome TaxID=412755 RepID=X0SD12_9ZZZZ